MAEFCLLGKLEVRGEGKILQVSPGKQRVLLATLLLSANQVVSADTLTEMLWGCQPPASAPVTLRNYVRRLRQALGSLGPDRISAQPRGYMITVASGELDVTVFATLAELASVAARDGDWGQAAARARTALSLWRGEPLADIESDALAQRVIPRLTEIRMQVLQTRIDADLRLGAHSSAVPELQALVKVHPLREELHALLMLALYQSGRRADALAAYQNARDLLIEELGTEPAVALRGLQQRILAGDPDLSAPRAAAVTASPAGLAAPVQRSEVPRQQPGSGPAPGQTAFGAEPDGGPRHLAERAMRQVAAATLSSIRGLSFVHSRGGRAVIGLLAGAAGLGLAAFLASTHTTASAGKPPPPRSVLNTFQGGADGWIQLWGDIRLALATKPALAGGSLLLTASGTGASAVGTASQVTQLVTGDPVTFHVWSSGQPGTIQPFVASDSNVLAYATATALPSAPGWFTLKWKVPSTSSVEGIGIQVVNPGNGSLRLALGDLSWP